MKGVIAAILGFLFVLGFWAFARAQPIHEGDSRKADLHVSQPLAVGDTVLKPGDYKFQCKHIDGQQFLVVTSDEDGREVARVPCKAEELQKKADVSEFRSVPRTEGWSRLTGVIIKGETIAHRVVGN